LHDEVQELRKNREENNILLQEKLQQELSIIQEKLAQD
jgi:hypothetical protein